MRFVTICLIGILLTFSSLLAAVEKQPVMGAGPSTAIATLFFEHFSKIDAAQGYRFVVEQRSIKHAGGIKASGKYLFGRTGRPLNQKEKAMDKHDLFLGQIPLAIVVGSKTGVTSINLEQLERILTGKISNWKQVGGVDHAIALAGRESTEAAFSVLKKRYSFFREAEFDQVFKRDHQLVNFLGSSKGAYAIGFGARSNFERGNVLTVEGFEAGVSLGFVYDQSNAEHPLVKAAISFAKSDAWKETLKDTEFLPPGDD